VGFIRSTGFYGALITIAIVGGIVGVIMQPTQATAILGFAAVVCANLITGYQGRRDAKKAAVAVEEVKNEAVNVATEVAAVKVEAKKQDTKLDEIQTVAKATHVLVNNDFIIQSRMVAELARWKADHDPTPNNIKAAEHAEAFLKDRIRTQEGSDVMYPPAQFGVMPKKDNDDVS
jgi:hypothetical protein